MAMTVKIYSTPTCPWCSKAKRYLKNNGIPFRDVDVSKDPQEAEAMVRKSGQMGVPVIEIGSEIIVGFDRQRIDRALGLNKI